MNIIEREAIADAVETFNLGADKTATDEQILAWDSTKAYIRGLKNGVMIKVWRLSFWELIKLWWMKDRYLNNL